MDDEDNIDGQDANINNRLDDPQISENSDEEVELIPVKKRIKHQPRPIDTEDEVEDDDDENDDWNDSDNDNTDDNYDKYEDEEKQAFQQLSRRMSKKGKKNKMAADFILTEAVQTKPNPKSKGKAIVTKKRKPQKRFSSSEDDHEASFTTPVSRKKKMKQNFAELRRKLSRNLADSRKMAKKSQSRLSVQRKRKL